MVVSVWVAATDDAALNRIIAQDAPCLVNVITEPELGNLSVPAQRSSGRLTFTAFGGGLPAFSRLLAQDMAKTYGGNFAAFADFLAEARQKVQQLPLRPHSALPSGGKCLMKKVLAFCTKAI